jgi:hypothetical protein
MEQMHRVGRVNTRKGEAGVSHLRDIDCTGDPSGIQKYFWTNYLPLMSHTQRVERGVKEAGTVGKTGRSEQHRSALGIIRSLVVHDDQLNNKTSTEKALHLFDQATDLFQEHERLKQQPGYKEWLEETQAYIMGSEHFSNARIDEQMKAVDELGEIMRPEMAGQKIKGVDHTGESLDLVKYRKVLKGTPANGNGHQKELRQELVFRGLTDGEVTKLFTTGLWYGEVLGRLIDIEIERVRKETNDNEAAIDRARKFFKPLSGAEFEDLPSMEATEESCKPKKRKAMKPLENPSPKRKRGSQRNRH